MWPVAIIQARMGSTRLPGKVLKPILGHPMLWHIVHRVIWAQEIEEVVVATSDLPGDKPIRSLCQEEGIKFFAGSESDVLDRFYKAAVEYDADPIIRITGDCPLVDPELIGKLLEIYKTGQYDHVGIATGAGSIFMDGERFPDGLDAECFSFATLERAWKEADGTAEMEHVTPFIWRHPSLFRLGTLKPKRDYSELRWTVDTLDDFQLVTQIYKALYRDDKPFLMADIIEYLACHPELISSNQSSIGMEGYLSIWRSAKK